MKRIKSIGFTGIVLATICLFSSFIAQAEEGSAPDAKVQAQQKLAADYFEALTGADVEKADAMAGVPYSLDRKVVLTTPGEVADMHRKIAKNKGKRDLPAYTIEKTDKAPELDRATFPEYVVYRISLTLPDRKHPQTIDIYVTDGDTPKVIGFSD